MLFKMKYLKYLKSNQISKKIYKWIKVYLNHNVGERRKALRAGAIASGATQVWGPGLPAHDPFPIPISLQLSYQTKAKKR